MQLNITKIEQGMVGKLDILNVVGDGKQFTVWKNTKNGKANYAYNHILEGGAGIYEVETWTKNDTNFSITRANKVKNGQPESSSVPIKAEATKQRSISNNPDDFKFPSERLKGRGIATNVGLQVASEVVCCLIKANTNATTHFDVDGAMSAVLKMQKAFTDALLGQLNEGV